MNDDVRLGLVVGGAALVVLAVLWWWIARSRRKRRIARGLRSTDPQERARAGVRLTELGLVRAARPLLDHVPGEQDARVRLAIALAVARRQWEPSNADRVARLREWASKELQEQGEPVSAFGPAVTRISDMGGPRPEGSHAHGTPASGPPAGSESPPDEAPSDGPPIEWTPGGAGGP
jgi:hypothetical protein